MSYHPEYSYWLSVEPKDANVDMPAESASLDDVLRALRRSDMAFPRGSMVFDIVDGRISGEVRPEDGTTPEDEGLIGILREIVTEFPFYQFTFCENNEEDKSIQRTTLFSDGAWVSEQHARLLAPDEYDKETIDAVVAYIQSNIETLRTQKSLCLANTDGIGASMKEMAIDACRNIINHITSENFLHKKG